MIVERQCGRFQQAESAVLRGNAAYGAGLALLMAGRADESRAWFASAAASWRESWDGATPTSWGRPIGVVKALLLAGEDAHEAAAWALGLGCAGAESPVGRYAAALALLVLGRDAEAGAQAASLASRDDFPADVAAALAGLAAADRAAYAGAAASVLASFETRDGYLEDVPVADTVLVLERLAAVRGIEEALRASPVLPG